jgi:hypothetical protein
MTLFNMFKTPYLDEIDAGGGAATQQTGTGAASTTGGEGGQQQEPKFKVKFNHEERELTYNEAVQYAQKGMKLDSILPEYEKLRTDPRLSFVESQAKKYGMTTEQYLDAVAKAEEEERLNELVQKNIPPEYAKEMLENRKFREEFQTKEQARQSQEKEQKDYIDFIDWYSKTYNKEVDPKSIPAEVWQAVKSGVPLKVAYMENSLNGYRSKEFEAERALQTGTANQKNANSSTGSVKTSGQTGKFFTKEQVEGMSTDEVYKNYDAIRESMRHWK